MAKTGPSGPVIDDGVVSAEIEKQANTSHGQKPGLGGLFSQSSHYPSNLYQIKEGKGHDRALEGENIDWEVCGDLAQGKGYGQMD